MDVSDSARWRVKYSDSAGFEKGAATIEQQILQWMKKEMWSVTRERCRCDKAKDSLEAVKSAGYDV